MEHFFQLESSYCSMEVSIYRSAFSLHRTVFQSFMKMLHLFFWSFSLPPSACRTIICTVIFSPVLHFRCTVWLRRTVYGLTVVKHFFPPYIISFECYIGRCMFDNPDQHFSYLGNFHRGYLSFLHSKVCRFDRLPSDFAKHFFQPYISIIARKVTAWQ